MDDKMLYKMQADVELLKDASEVQSRVNKNILATIENIYHKDIGGLKAAIAKPHERLARIEEALAVLLSWHEDYEWGLTNKAVIPLVEALKAVTDGAREGSGTVCARSEAGASGSVQPPASKRDA